MTHSTKQNPIQNCARVGSHRYSPVEHNIQNILVQCQWVKSTAAKHKWIHFVTQRKPKVMLTQHFIRKNIWVRAEKKEKKHTASHHTMQVNFITQRFAWLTVEAHPLTSKEANSEPSSSRTHKKALNHKHKEEAKYAEPICAEYWSIVRHTFTLTTHTEIQFG